MVRIRFPPRIGPTQLDGGGPAADFDPRRAWDRENRMKPVMLRTTQPPIRGNSTRSVPATYFDVSVRLMSRLPVSGMETVRPEVLAPVYLAGTPYSKRTGSPPSRLPLAPSSFT